MTETFDRRRKLFQTGVDRDGERFSTSKLWKGHRAVTEPLVDFMRETARESESEGERARAKAWLAEYEEKSK